MIEMKAGAVIVEDSGDAQFFESLGQQRRAEAADIAGDISIEITSQRGGRLEQAPAFQRQTREAAADNLPDRPGSRAAPQPLAGAFRLCVFVTQLPDYFLHEKWVAK